MDAKVIPLKICPLRLKKFCNRLGSAAECMIFGEFAAEIIGGSRKALTGCSVW